MQKRLDLLEAFFLIALFLVFAWRGVKIAKRNKDSFFQLDCSWDKFFGYFFQAFIHIGSMAGILPILAYHFRLLVMGELTL